MQFLLVIFLLSTSLTQVQSGERLRVDVQVLDQSVAIMEGGNFSIDIRREPVPLKSDAMQDYLTTDSAISPCQGAYFGNQNQSISDRDAAMVEVKGLKVYGVDAQQETIIDGVEPIGFGLDATLKKLQEIMSLGQRPSFIGFDVDDTLLGYRTNGSKEELLLDRFDLAEAIAQLALEDVKIVFFSDGDSKLTLKRVGYPLMQLIHGKNLREPITLTFYTSGMLTKFKLTTHDNSVPTIAFDAEYKAECRLNAKSVLSLSSIIGEVIEDEEGKMKGFGILADYYFNFLTCKNEAGAFVRNQDFFPEFLTQISPKGNVVPPTLEWRDYNAVTGVSMLSIAGLPSAYRPLLIHAIKEELKRSLN